MPDPSDVAPSADSYPDALTQARATPGLSQEEAALKAGISVRAWGDYERGKKEPSNRTRKAIQDNVLAPARGAAYPTGAGASAPRVGVAREAPPAYAGGPTSDGPVAYYVVDQGRRIAAVRPFPEWVALDAAPELTLSQHFALMGAKLIPA